MQQNKQINWSSKLALPRTQFAIRICAREYKGSEVPVSKDGAGYQPVAWWFTKRRIGRELRNLYKATEELPPQLLALVRKLGGKPDGSLEAKSEGCGSSRHP